ncbi:MULTISPECIES: DDE-type integrase/transposase/recombinase [Paraburkholderia]|uniref:DDE-type integrase/transposase/recombinase n=1 Tax=Paraburkholderia podalyriae TaxID=1938811 RepID=A0ABR7PG43_9BURK|nr:DDE-type integrase/transposase/recombinase [Paraburkholderia podalyriae]MBC8745333.1 DDE-type integrase/transposase/recombinase [Paraburkholderia podalyriae]
MPIYIPTTIPIDSEWKRMENRWSLDSPIGTALPPYTDAELRQEFERWGTPVEGQEYIWDTRANSPSRKVKSRVGNVVSHYSSRKMRRRMATESRKPEYGAVVRYDFDGTTREFYCQPPQVRLSVETERKLSDGNFTVYQAPTPYTPDILRITPYGVYVDEWKSERDLEKLAERYPRRFFKDDDGTWRCPEREKFFGEMGFTFCLRSGSENGAIFVTNLEFLEDFLSDRCTQLGDSAWQAIERITRDSCPMTLGLLLTHAYPEQTPWNETLLVETPPNAFLVDDVYKAIADQRLFVDLEYDDLSEPQDVVLCNSRAQLDALQFNRPVPKAVSDKIAFDVEIGTEFMLDGRPEVYEVSLVNANTVHYFDQQSRNGGLMPVAEFERATFRREIILLSSLPSTDERLSQIDGLTDYQIVEGKNRFLMVRELEAGKRVRCNLSTRQIQRIRKAVRAAGESLPARRRAATPKRRSGGRCQVTESQLEMIRTATEWGNNPTNPGGRASYRKYRELSLSAKADLVSRKTFYERRKRYIDIKARQGGRVTYNEEPATWYLHLEDKINGGRPFHRVHIDHTKLDVFIAIRGKGGRIFRKRPWLTLIMDAETRAVLGFYLSIHAPSTVSCMMAIRAMVRIFRRTPSVIVVDNGKEFHSAAFDRLCDLLYITLQFRPAHESRFGGVMERLFGTTNTELIHNLVGNTKALRNVRTVTRSVDPIRADLLSFAQLHGLLDEYFYRDYNLRVHPAHDHAPIEYMNLRFAVTGRRLARLTPYDSYFYILTCIPPSKGTTRKLDKQMGVLISHIWYWADEFADKEVRPQNLEVLVDMWDVSIVYALLNGKWVRCQSKLLMKYRKLTYVEWGYVMYEVRMRMRGEPEENLENVLYAVISDHALPDAASLTAATRQVYGQTLLVGDATPGANAAGIDLPIITPAEPGPPDDDSVMRIPVTKLARGRLKMNYDSLPTSRPV